MRNSKTMKTSNQHRDFVRFLFADNFSSKIKKELEIISGPDFF